MNNGRSQWIGSSNRGYSVYAKEELRRLFASISFEQLVPGEVFLIDIPENGEEANTCIRKHEPIFLRHIHPVERQLDRSGTEDAKELLQMIEAFIPCMPEASRIAVQFGISDQVQLSVPLSVLKKTADEELTEQNFTPVLQGSEAVLSVFIMADRWYAGLSAPQDNLSDWPGGRIRFKKDEHMISRAKFKLEEAGIIFGLDYSVFDKALDIGAAPGGWSSLLLEHGVHVTAVDPAELDDRVKRHPRLSHLQSNAAVVQFPAHSFDLLVCDMSWSPRRMAGLVGRLTDSMKPGGIAVITVKLMHKKPFRTIKEVLKEWPDWHLIQAKQLFHNRDELTLCLQANEIG